MLLFKTHAIGISESETDTAVATLCPWAEKSIAFHAPAQSTPMSGCDTDRVRSSPSLNPVVHIVTIFATALVT